MTNAPAVVEVVMGCHVPDGGNSGPLADGSFPLVLPARIAVTDVPHTGVYEVFKTKFRLPTEAAPLTLKLPNWPGPAASS